MKLSFVKLNLKTMLGAVGLVLTITIAANYSFWWPTFSSLVDRTLKQRRVSKASVDEHAGHDHGPGEHDEHAGQDHAGHDAGTSLELNAQALKNLGLSSDYLKPIALSDYKRTITIPAIVATKPGRTQIRVSSPLSGVVTHVHAVTGEAVTAGELLFEVRLTYEDLVDTQTQFLKTLSDLDVERREIARLEEVTQSGAISAKTLLERRYSKCWGHHFFKSSVAYRILSNHKRIDSEERKIDVPIRFRHRIFRNRRSASPLVGNPVGRQCSVRLACLVIAVAVQTRAR